MAIPVELVTNKHFHGQKNNFLIFIIKGYKNSLLDLANLASGVRREKFGLYFEVFL